MNTTEKRQLTEAEALFVEEAFSEYAAKGSTGKTCPWCAGELKFDAVVSGYRIHCAQCRFNLSARGI